MLLLQVDEQSGRLAGRDGERLFHVYHDPLEIGVEQWSRLVRAG